MKVKGPDGQEREAEPVEVEDSESEENWSVYKLSDGTKLRIKPVVVKVARVKGEYKPDGSPVYTIEAQNVVGTESPDDLKKTSEGEG